MSNFIQYEPINSDMRLASEVYENFGHGANDAAHRIAKYRIDLEAERDAWKAKAERYHGALVKVMAHIGIPLVPTYELLYGLIESIGRIARAALSAIDPDAIKRECAEEVDQLAYEFGLNNQQRMMIGRAILGAEPAREKDGCFRCRNRPLPGASGELCKSCKLVIGKNYDPIPILATEPAREESE